MKQVRLFLIIYVCLISFSQANEEDKPELPMALELLAGIFYYT